MIWRYLCQKTLNLAFKALVRCQWAANTPVHQPSLATSHLILYVLPHRSRMDLLVLQQYCRKNCLPDPFIPITVQHQQLPRYFFIEDKSLQLPGQGDQAANLLCPYLGLLSDSPSPLGDHPLKELQIVLASPVWGRTPGYDVVASRAAQHHWLSRLEKIFRVIWFGRDTFIYLSKPLLLRDIVDQLPQDRQLMRKLIRLARIQLTRHYRMITGPQLPKRRRLLDHLLQTKSLREAITSEVRSKRADSIKTTRMAAAMFDEMAAHFSYGFIRCADILFSWLWHNLYQGITVHNAESVRQCALAGDGLVYLPCHRSHMDYLLLSFVLHNQGLVPPHIAAGSNLNFWPVGSLFRRTGAFFIRRSFKGSKLYSMVFQEYLAALFTQGCSVEFFIEGGRSRTGHLLSPKTGMLSMTLQAMLQRPHRPITLIPVYIGYEHIMEERTYAKERGGALKQPESFQQLLTLFRDLRDLGEAHVNFGEPIRLSAYLDQQQPDWRQLLTATRSHRMNRLAPVVNRLAKKIMVDINKAVAVDAVSLCVTVLLAADQNSLPYSLVVQQLTFYLNLLQNIPYSSVCTIPVQSAAQLIDQALKMKKLSLISAEHADEATVMLPRQQAAVLGYYRNTIQHLLSLPSLTASLLLNLASTSTATRDEEVLRYIVRLYPLLQAALFVEHTKRPLPQLLWGVISELAAAQLVKIEGKPPQHYRVSLVQRLPLQLLAANLHDLLRQCLIILSLLVADPQLSRLVLVQRAEKITRQVAQCLGNGQAAELPTKGDVMARLLQLFRSADQARETHSLAVLDWLDALSKTLPPAQVQLIEKLTRSVTPHSN